MKIKNWRLVKKEIIAVAIIVLTISMAGIAYRSYANFDSYEDQKLFEELVMQGYSIEVATDEVWERKGKPDVYGTGGIDGISTYGTCDFGGGGGGTTTTQPQNPAKAHTHLWGEGVAIKEATCSEEGIEKFTCSCGQTRTEKIPKKDHSYESVETAATCTEYHKIVYTCTECGDTFTIEYPEEGYADHIYIPTEDSVEATCEEKGLIKYVCNVCGDSYEEEVEALGHEFTKYTTDIEPDCLKEGEKSIYCDRCGVKQEDSTVKIPALGHTENPNHEIVAATFWKDGLETTYCQRCGEKLDEVVLPATGGVFRIIVPIAGGVILLLAVTLIIISKKKK